MRSNYEFKNCKIIHMRDEVLVLDFGSQYENIGYFFGYFSLLTRRTIKKEVDNRFFKVILNR